MSWDDSIVVCLAEVNSRPVIASLSDAKRFSCLQRLVKQATRLLWATAADSSHALYPCYGLVHGFLRTIRAEQPDSRIVSIAIEGQVDAAACANYISTAFRTSFETPCSNEVEYIVRDGKIMTGRAAVDASGNKLLAVAPLSPVAAPRMERLSGVTTRSRNSRYARLSTVFFFAYDAAHETSLGAGEIEIEAMAWGLNFRDVLIALGRYSETPRRPARS